MLAILRVSKNVNTVLASKFPHEVRVQVKYFVAFGHIFDLVRVFLWCLLPKMVVGGD
jgi:hypothetical protein